MEDKIGIFVACHKQSQIAENPLLIPIQVGASLTDDRYFGMICDKTGKNISDKNKEYCELTAQYWAWKNTDYDYYGFFHYRRYLTFNHVIQVESDRTISKKRVRPYKELDCIPKDLVKYGLDLNLMEQTIPNYDIITVLREKLDVTVYQQYCQYHPKENLDILLDIIKVKTPEYMPAAYEYMNAKCIYYMNMYIMKKNVFCAYMTWLFDILSDYEKVKGYRNLEPRIMGYLAERLFGIFYTYQRSKGYKCAEVPYLKFYDTGEGEDKRNIRTFHLGSSKYELRIDMRKVNRLFPAGSRRRLFLRKIILKNRY